jgi:RNA polymerase sigma-70 factor (ECF subfamily)
MVDMAEERSLIEASQRGDLQAFAGLVRANQRMVHSLTFRMTGSWSDAQDLAQETLVQAHRQLGSFRFQARFSSWLYRIAVNQCLNWHKRQRREARLRAECPPPETRSTHASAAAEEVQAALLKLNPKQRAAIILTTYEGHNHAEAARVLGCSEVTVSWHLFTARARLKTLLRHLRPSKDPA